MPRGRGLNQTRLPVRIARDELSSILEDSPAVASRRPARVNLNQLTDKLRLHLRKDIATHMQPWMVLLDESVRFFIYLEQYQYTRKLQRETSPFALQLSRLRSDIISIRELITLGQEASAHSIARTFVDRVELARALADDPQFAVEYFEAEDESSFWRNHIAYGRIYRRVNRFLRRLGGSDKQVEELVSTHRAIKDALSGHIHIASYSALRAGLIPSITKPGLFHYGQIGSVSAHMPGLCLLVANETHTFSACCINAFIKKDPPLVFSTYRPSTKLHNVVASAHVLQELLLRHGDALSELGNSFFAQDQNETV